MIKQINYLNPGGNEEKQIFHALFGEEKEAETNFPKLTELFHKQEKRDSMPMVGEDIASVIVKGKKMFAYISMMQEAIMVNVQVTICGIRTDGSEYEEKKRFNGSGRYIESPEWNLEGGVTYTKTDIKYMFWNGTGTNSLLTGAGSVSIPIEINDFIETHKLLAPIKKGGETETIYVIYDRAGKADYYYHQEREGWEPFQIMLPISVRFDVAASIGELTFKNWTAVLLPIQKHYKNERGVSLTLEKSGQMNTYCLNFQEEWKNTISDTDMQGEDKFRLHAEVNLESSKGGSVMLDIMSVEHPNDPGYGRCFETLPIYILWGCIEKNALIRLKGKGVVKASEVKVGDYIHTVNGAYSKVTNVYRGREEMMRYIKTENIETGIYVTRDHPMLTQSGWKRAIELRMGDSIQTEQDFSVITEIYTDPYQDEVVNFELEGAEGFFANGYYVGDIFTESGLKKKKDEAKMLPPELEKEFQKFLEL